MKSPLRSQRRGALFAVATLAIAHTLLACQVAVVYLWAALAKMTGGESRAWGLPTVLSSALAFSSQAQDAVSDSSMPSWGVAVPRALALSTYHHPGSSLSIFTVVHLSPCMNYSRSLYCAPSPCVVMPCFLLELCFFCHPYWQLWTAAIIAQSITRQTRGGGFAAVIGQGAIHGGGTASRTTSSPCLQSCIWGLRARLASTTFTCISPGLLVAHRRDVFIDGTVGKRTKIRGAT